MLDASQMTVPVVLCDISPYEKSTYLLVGLTFKKSFPPVFQTNLYSTPFFKMRYDWIYSSHVYSGST